jgi:hypothetical protein
MHTIRSNIRAFSALCPVIPKILQMAIISIVKLNKKYAKYNSKSFFKHKIKLFHKSFNLRRFFTKIKTTV